MMPTLNAVGDLVLTEHLSFRIRGVRRGDVVVCKSPKDPKQTICKRVVGLAWGGGEESGGRGGGEEEQLIGSEE